MSAAVTHKHNILYSISILLHVLLLAVAVSTICEPEGYTCEYRFPVLWNGQ